MKKLYNLSSYNYDLPAENIAQFPAVPRDTSKLLVWDVKENKISDNIFYSHEFDNLLLDDYIKAVDETLLRLNELKEKSKKEELRKILRSENISQQEKLQILQNMSKN